jgi:2-dehydro-3-deoxy-D-arabinonate dehydratase
VEESDVRDVYERVYDADRPELFFKAQGWRAVGDGAAVGVRADSHNNVPEPELALVVNAQGDTIGYTVCNDLSSRSIEGQNPLYLPQAKIYERSCGIGPGIRPAWLVEEPDQLEVKIAVGRGEEVVWSGKTSTGLMHRRYADLIEHLFRALAFPYGVVLSTGTGLVPGLEFTLDPGDTVEIAIDQVGTLINSVMLVGAGTSGAGA